MPGRDWTAREEVKIKMIIILEKRRLDRRFFHNKSMRRIQLRNEKEYLWEVLGTDYKNHENSEYKDLTERVKSKTRK